MPTRADIEAATPRCQASHYEARSSINFGLRGGTTHHNVERLCLKTMRYRAGDNTWVCECGSKEAGEAVGGRALAFEMEAQAA